MFHRNPFAPFHHCLTRHQFHHQGARCRLGISHPTTQRSNELVLFDGSRIVNVYHLKELHQIHLPLLWNVKNNTCNLTCVWWKSVCGIHEHFMIQWYFTLLDPRIKCYWNLHRFVARQPASLHRLILGGTCTALKSRCPKCLHTCGEFHIQMRVWYTLWTLYIVQNGSTWIMGSLIWEIGRNQASAGSGVNWCRNKDGLSSPRAWKQSLCMNGGDDILSVLEGFFCFWLKR